MLIRDSVAFGDETLEDDFVVCDSLIFEWKRIVEAGDAFFVSEYPADKFSVEQIIGFIEERYQINLTELNITPKNPTTQIIKIPFELGKNKLAAVSACAEEIKTPSYSYFNFFKEVKSEEKNLPSCTPRFDLTKVMRGVNHVKYVDQIKYLTRMEDSLKKMFPDMAADYPKLKEYIQEHPADSFEHYEHFYDTHLARITVNSILSVFAAAKTDARDSAGQENNIAILNRLEEIEDQLTIGMNWLLSFVAHTNTKLEDTKGSALLLKVRDWVHEQKENAAVFASVSSYQAKIPKAIYDEMLKESKMYYPLGMPAHAGAAVATAALTYGYGGLLVSSFAAHPILATGVHVYTKGALFKPLKILPQGAMDIATAYGYACRINILPEWIQGDHLLPAGHFNEANPHYRETKEETVTCYFLHSGFKQTIFEKGTNYSLIDNLQANPHGHSLLFTSSNLADITAATSLDIYFDPIGGFNYDHPWTATEREQIHIAQARRNDEVLQRLNHLPDALSQLIVEYVDESRRLTL